MGAVLPGGHYFRKWRHERKLHVKYWPADGLDDALQLIVGGRVAPAHREHEVDGVKEARERLGQVSCFIRLKRILQGPLGTARTQMNSEWKGFHISCLKASLGEMLTCSPVCFERTSQGFRFLAPEWHPRRRC